MYDIGSMAVLGLAAKPVLDIGIAVTDIRVISSCVEKMKYLDYVYFGDQKQRGDHFFAKGLYYRETCFAHMVQADDPAWHDFLQFRDYLIEHPDYRDRYDKLKTQMAA